MRERTRLDKSAKGEGGEVCGCLPMSPLYIEHCFAVLKIKHSKVCGCLPMPPESHEGDLKPSKIEYLCPDNKRLILMAMTIITVRQQKRL